MIAAKSIAVLLSAGLLLGSLAPAMAEDSAPVSVKVNMARILRIDAPAATVIIGNPGVADVTIQDPQTLVLTGKSYGITNLIILNASGNPIADTMIEVTQDLSGIVTMYNGSARQSFNCEPTCQSVIMMGDDSGFTGQAVGSSQTIQGVANSSN
jgi:Flp pilus assembly secretin CpaC